ncbi:MAG: helix-turn-helix domain-containing protein [Deltaproteobacteria bacterium]
MEAFRPRPTGTRSQGVSDSRVPDRPSARALASAAAGNRVEVTQLARVDADLAAARLSRAQLDHAWGHAMYTAGCRGRRSPKELDVALAQMDATIAQLEASRETLLGTAAAAPPPVPPAPGRPSEASPGPPAFLDTRAAAELLRVSVKTLEALRARHQGPPWKRVGRRVQYEHAAMLEWARQQ